MERIITIVGRTGRFDEPSFLLTENDDLIIRFKFLNQKSVGRYIVVVRHGSAPKKTFSLTDDKIIILYSDWLNIGGTAPIIFDMELRDSSCVLVYKKYDIEDLKIKESDVGMEYFSDVQALELENAELRKELGEVKAELADVKKIVADIPAEIEKAKKEAVIEAAGGDPMGA